MAKQDGKQYKVGLFVSLGILLVIASIFILGGSRSYFTKLVPIHARFASVQGLNSGSTVSFMGVSVGNISRIEFLEKENQLDVEMRIDSNYISRITVDSTVEARTQGALGDRYVYINPGDPSKPCIKEGDLLEANKGGDLMGIISERSGEAGKIFDIIGEVHKVVKAMNDGNRSEKIFANFAEAAIQLNKTAQESHLLISEIRNQSSPKFNGSIEKLDRILTKIDNGEGSLGALINDSSIHDRIKTLVGGSSRKKAMKSLIRGSIEKGSSVNRETSSQ
jgi:phospholipid/cholesterol/gamma-HCH transport system substrate-binding protein